MLLDSLTTGRLATSAYAATIGSLHPAATRIYAFSPVTLARRGRSISSQSLSSYLSTNSRGCATDSASRCYALHWMGLPEQRNDGYPIPANRRTACKKQIVYGVEVPLEGRSKPVPQKKGARMFGGAPLP